VGVFGQKGVGKSAIIKNLKNNHNLKYNSNNYEINILDYSSLIDSDNYI